MLGSLEKLSLYDSAETTTSKGHVFKGDIDISGLPEDVVPYEAPETSARNILDDKPSSSPASKRFKSESPEVPDDEVMARPPGQIGGSN